MEKVNFDSEVKCGSFLYIVYSYYDIYEVFGYFVAKKDFIREVVEEEFIQENKKIKKYTKEFAQGLSLWLLKNDYVKHLSITEWGY